MKHQVPSELLDLVKLHMGAGAVIILACDSKLPCPDEISGDGCNGNHLMVAGSSGISPANLKDVLQDAADNTP